MPQNNIFTSTILHERKLAGKIYSQAVYKGLSREPEKVSFINSFPLYTD